MFTGRWALPIWGAVIAVFGVLARWPYAFSRATPQLQPDTFAYFSIADRLRDGHPFAASGTTRGPGYPAFVVLADLLPGAREGNVVLVQHALGVLVALGFLWWAWRALGPVTAVLGALTVALSPLLFAIEDDALPDMLLGVLLLGLGIAIGEIAVRAPRRVGWWWLVACGLLLGVCALTKPVAEAALVAPFLAFAAVRWPWREAVRGGLLVVAGFVIVVTPFVLHSTIRFGEPSLVRNSGDTLFTRVFEIDQRPIPQDTADGRAVAEGIRENPGARFYVIARVVLTNSHHGDARGVDRRERALALRAIRKYPVGYIYKTFELSDRFLVQDYASPHVVDVFHPRAGGSSTGLSDAIFDVGGWLARRWWMLSLHGFAFLLAMLIGPWRRRMLSVALVSVAVPVALLTAAAHGGLPRYSWSLIPITYTMGVAGFVAGAIALWNGRRSVGPDNLLERRRQGEPAGVGGEPVAGGRAHRVPGAVDPEDGRGKIGG